VYHRVVSPSNDPYSFVTCGGVPAIDSDELASDLAYLEGNGALFLTFDDLCSGRFPSERETGIIVAFDDCFYDNYTHGIEVLSTLGVKGTVETIRSPRACSVMPTPCWRQGGGIDQSSD
jgi:hypothetical protein